jgi:membrane protease YdiL (CAAX protease family)
MTAQAAALRSAVAPATARRWLAPVLLLGALATVVLARWAATRLGLDALLAGVGFGLALAAIAIPRASWRLPAARLHVARQAVSWRRGARDVGIGAFGGVGLVMLALAGAALAGATLIPGLGRPAAPFAPWAAITIVVATAEEALLRGRLFDAIRRAGGVGAAIVVTTLAFALMHVPLYGWHVVPLDVGVGLVLAALRLGTGGVLAPATAHAVADLATWWL